MTSELAVKRLPSGYPITFRIRLWCVRSVEPGRYRSRFGICVGLECVLSLVLRQLRANKLVAQ